MSRLDPTVQAASSGATLTADHIAELAGAAECAGLPHVSYVLSTLAAATTAELEKRLAEFIQARFFVLVDGKAEGLGHAAFFRMDVDRLEADLADARAVLERLS